VNPPLAFSDALTQLQLLTSQEANFTFTTDEMTQALQGAWNDGYVTSVFLDNSTIFTLGTWTYPIPGSVTTVRELMYTRTTTDNLETLSPELYTIIDSNIIFLPAASRWLLTGMIIYVKGVVKLTTDDSLPTANLVNYVIYSAAEGLLDRLLLKASFVFLRNDISVSDITRAIQTISGRTLRYKQAILREFESS
jgi:hypothetical protein